MDDRTESLVAGSFHPMDGYEVARHVRNDPALERVMLVALTGYGSDEAKRSAIAAGFDHHVVKPVNLDALQDLVARVAQPGAPLLQ